MLTRDGTSSYYINNLPARRRDIQDIFLGTGLGPRAYAIIGQGMIARLIEAKPEELRVFLEEAAGVSKYKERRRETENRLHDTRENLTRVEDIVRELSANLEKLEAQAVVATTRYKELQAEGEEKQRLLWLLRKNEAGSEARSVSGARSNEAQIDLEAQTAQVCAKWKRNSRRCASRTTSASDAMQGAQGALYEANADVSKLEGRDQVHRRIAQPRAGADRRAHRAARAVARAGREGARRSGRRRGRSLPIAEENAASRRRKKPRRNTTRMPALEARWRDAQVGAERRARRHRADRTGAQARSRAPAQRRPATCSSCSSVTSG